ncbi:MAG: isochorismatase family protein [Caldilineaceae bacterium]|nr:isochorismatase family protein [Caldilineaceae bacterium]
MKEQHRLTLHLRQWQLAQDSGGYNEWQLVTQQRTLTGGQVAIIICDMWDKHWSRGAVEREALIIPRMNAALAGARAKGVHVIHAPSETMDFYAEHPARQRILALPPVAPPPDREQANPPLPVDASDGGSDTGEPKSYKAWSRQHADLVVDTARDLISDNGSEIYSYLQANGIAQVLIMGVHTNMCILNRSFAIKQMVKWGVNIALVRDLTDTMYNPAMPPYVPHAEGTRLVVEYIEKFWCPSLLSADLL